MGRRMLYAVLICTDGDCDAVYEAWGEPRELEVLVCEGCGCCLEIVAFSEARDEPPHRVEVQLRDAA